MKTFVPSIKATFIIICMKSSKTIFRVFFLSCLFLIQSTGFPVFAQSSEPEKIPILRLGIDGGINYINPVSLNYMIGQWLDLNNILVMDELIDEIHIGFSGSAYLSIEPIPYVDLRPEYCYDYIPKIFRYENGGDALNIKTTVNSFGASINGLYKALRIGAGIYNYDAKLIWEDGIDYYKLEATGDTWGYKVFLGLRSNPSGTVSFNFTVCYKNALFKELKDEQGRTLINMEDDQNFTLDLSGFEVRMGLAFSLVKIKPLLNK